MNFDLNSIEERLRHCSANHYFERDRDSRSSSRSSNGYRDFDHLKNNRYSGNREPPAKYPRNY